MSPSPLFYLAAALLSLGAAGHTLGGMLGIARKGAEAGPEADRVFTDMKSVRFVWQGADSSWFDFWMGNGLSVSALLVLPIVTLVQLGGAKPEEYPTVVPYALATAISLALVATVSLRHFGPKVAGVFALVAALTMAGAVGMVGG